MSTKLLAITSIVAGVVLAGAAGVTVMGSAGDGGDEQGFLSHIHQMARGIHGGGHGHGGGHFGQMAELVDQLELTEDQARHFENIHSIVGSYGKSGHDSMNVLHTSLMEQFEQGYVDNAEIRKTIDEHVDQLRSMAYDATDELVALVNGLDERQRGIVLEHIEAAKRGGAGREHGHGHDH